MFRRVSKGITGFLRRLAVVLGGILFIGAAMAGIFMLFFGHDHTKVYCRNCGTEDPLSEGYFHG